MHVYTYACMPTSLAPALAGGFFTTVPPENPTHTHAHTHTMEGHSICDLLITDHLIHPCMLAEVMWKGNIERNTLRHGLLSAVLGSCRFVLLLSLLLCVFENFYKMFKSERQISMLKN